MAGPSTWLLGVELLRFAASDDQAEALSSSLSALEAGGWELSPYAGPAIQPYVGWKRGAFAAILAPGLAFRRELAASEDGREAALRTTQLRVGLRAQVEGEVWFAGVEAAWSGGQARLDGETVASGASRVELGPTAGVRVALVRGFGLTARARLPVALQPDDLSVVLSGAVALEWRGGGG